MVRTSSQQLPALIGYAGDIRKSAPRLSALTLILLLAASLFEGVGYILLLPIISYLGVTSSRQDAPSESIHPVIDPLLNTLSTNLSLGLLLLMFLGVLILRAALTYLAASSSARLKGQFLHHHRKSLHKAIIESSWSFLSAKRRSIFTHALTDQSNIIVNGVDTLYRALATLLTTGVAVFIALLLSWKITLGLILLSLIIIWPLLHFNRRAFALGERARHDMTALFEHSIRYFNGLKTIKAASAEDDVNAYFEDKSQSQSRVFSELERNHARASLAFQLLSAVLLVGFVYGALTYFPQQKAQIIVLIIIFARLAPRINALQSYGNNLTAMIPEYVAAKDLRIAAAQAGEAQNIPRPPLIIKQGLALSNITFTYSGTEQNRAVLEDLSVSFPMKSSTAIVGPSGIGKTTIADIISGLRSPIKGDVIIDGNPLSTAERHSLAQSIQYMTDEDFLFDGSVRQNLLLGHSDVEDSDIWDALKKANAYDFMKALPQGLETQIGDSGTRLSHGQRQRLSLARGLLGKPQILILDEPTSALNQQDKVQVIKTLKSLSREIILIIITHDEASFHWVDQIVRVDTADQIKSS